MEAQGGKRRSRRRMGVDRVSGKHVNVGLVVLICLFIAGLEGYDIQAFGVAAPRMVAELGLSPAQQGWAGAAAMIGLTAGAFLGGWGADRVGRRPVLTASVAAFGIFSLATAMCADYPTLLLARFAAGLGFGGAMSNLIAVATEISAPGRRAVTVTGMFCGMPAGGAVVSLIARFAGEGVDWRTLFIIGGVLPILLAPAVHFLLPETRPAPVAGADRRVLPALFGGGRAVGTLLMWTTFLLTLAVLNLMLAWLPTLVTAKGLTAMDGSSAALAFNLSGIVGAILTGLAVDRFGSRWTLTLVYAGLAGAMFVLATAIGLPAMLVFSGLAGFLVMGAQFSLYSEAPGRYPPHMRAAGSGAAVGVGRLGSVAGPLIAGELRQAGYAAGDVFFAIIPIVLTAGLAAMALSFRGRAYEE